MERFWEKVNIKTNKECWEWKGVLSGNYGMFWFEGTMVLAHRMSYAIHYDDMSIINHTKSYHENNNEFDCILHHCDNPKCCNPNHLYIGNNKDNIHDKVIRNRAQRLHGDLNGNSKLSEQDVINIRSEYISRKNGGVVAIAKKYKISSTNVHDIIKRKIWKHI